MGKTKLITLLILITSVTTMCRRNITENHEDLLQNQEILKDIVLLTFPEPADNINIEIIKRISRSSLIINVGEGQYYHIKSSQIDSFSVNNNLIRVYDSDSLLPNYRDYIGDNPKNYNMLIDKDSSGVVHYYYVKLAIPITDTLSFDPWNIIE